MSIDANGNGKISLAELDKAVLVLWPRVHHHKPVLIRAFQAADGEWKAEMTTAATIRCVWN